jgi:DNA-binding transcriptional LysR family regulator
VRSSPWGARVRIPDYAAIGHVIANTDLIATVPRLVADTLARSSPLQVVKPPLRLRGFGVCVYWHERYDTDPGLQWFRDVLCALAP